MAVGAESTAKAAEGGGHGGLGKGWKGVHIEAARGFGGLGIRIDEREQAAAAVGGMDGVHLEVAGFGVMVRGRREVVNHVLGGVVARDVGGGRLALGFPVALVGERSAARIPKLAFVHQSIDGAATGEIRVGRGLAKRLQCVGDALRFGICLCEVLGKEVGDLAAGAFVRGAPLGLLLGGERWA